MCVLMCERVYVYTYMYICTVNSMFIHLSKLLVHVVSLFPVEDESGEMPLMKLTEEDRQVLMDSLKEVEIDYHQLELLDTIGEGTVVMQ